ncbi:MAG: phenylacetic acid degradation bifunctional protein PaaZ, partial [Pseudomonadota bacterium]
MTLQQISSFAAGAWVGPGAGARMIASAITGEPIATAGNNGLDVQSMLDHARNIGGPALRSMTFHDRAR